jgi:hypothetical protein
LRTPVLFSQSAVAAWGQAGNDGGSVDRKAASEAFKDEARDTGPNDAPWIVGTDGWKGTQAAWKILLPKLVILLGFLQARLKIRDRAICAELPHERLPFWRIPLQPFRSGDKLERCLRI